MRKYLGLLAAFFRASAISDLEFRLNIALKFLTDIIWYVAQLSIFEVLFKQTNSIAGWTVDSTRVFMGVLFLVDAIWMLIFSENLDRMSEKVRKGDLDLLLTKPVNSQFIMSTQKISTAYLGNILFACLWLGWALNRIPDGVVWTRLLFLIVLVPCGLMISYGLRFMFSAASVIFTRADNIVYIWHQLYRLGTRPDAIYPPWLRYAVLTIVPVGFIASVPSRMILHEPDFLSLGGAVVIAIASVWASSRFWRFALKSYSSASS